jgi:AraC-like DNA-binding protein
VQLLNFLIVSFVLWRVETLQELNAEGDSDAADVTQTAPVFQTNALDGKGENLSRLSSTALTTTITRLLREHCEEPRLYLRHDLTLAQLAEAVGTNRTYLSQYFAQQGITYNAYINRLRIDHFVELYRDATGRPQPSGSTVTAQSLAWQSGFKSYSTFGVAFKRFMGQTVSEWMKG